MITLTHAGRGIVFKGCSDCLIAELDVLGSYRGPQCSSCGAAKVPVAFVNTGVKRLECPVHVNAARLLGQSLHSLTLSADGQTQGLCEEIRKTLGLAHEA